MKRVALTFFMLVLASFACAKEKTEASIQDGNLYVRSDFGANRYLVREIKLAEKDWTGNQVVNFGGARIVSSLFDMRFNRGYLVSGEVDDIAPMRFNDTFVGANHGSFYGVKVHSRNHGLNASAIGSRWSDSSGANFTLRLVDGPDDVTYVADDEGGRWTYRPAAGDLSENNGSLRVDFSDQARVQIYPSVRRISLSVGTGNLAILGDKYKRVPRIEVSEIYDVLSPLGDRVVRVWNRYTFRGNSTQVRTYVRALTTVEGFSMVGTQAVALNYSGAHLEQRVPGSAAFSSWRDITREWKPTRIESVGALESFQRVVGAPLKFGLSVGVSKAELNGKVLEPVGAVDISEPRKQYPVAIEPGQDSFDGTLYQGDVVEIEAYRRYWPGEEPPPAK